MSFSTLLISQGASSATLNFVNLLDPNPSTSVSITNDGITATATTTSSDGLGVSFNQGLGVNNAGGSKTDINNGDRVKITFDQPVDVGQVGMRLWGVGLGGDSANIVSSEGTQFLVGAGDVQSGTVDIFDINLTNVTEMFVDGLGNHDNPSIGGFFLGLLDDVVLSGSGIDPVVVDPVVIDTGSVEGDPSVSAVPVPAAFWLFSSALFGMTGLQRFRSKKV